MCGITQSSPAGPFRARAGDLGFDAVAITDDIHVLRARSTYWPAPGNIVVVEDDDGVALIDCGFGTEEALDAVQAALRGLGLDLAAVHTVLVTHPHLDHAGGIGLLPEHVQVLGPARLGSLVADAAAASELIFPHVVRGLAVERADLDIVEHFRTDCGTAAGEVKARELEPGEVVAVGRTRWTAVSTPGHESGMYSYFEPELGILVCSDVLTARGTAIPWYAPGGGGTKAYLAGLERIEGLEASLGIRGHGDIIHGGTDVAAVVADTADRIASRTRAVHGALRNGPLTFEQLEDQIYPARVYDVIPWASSVLATHLLEGLEDDALVHEGDLFRTTARLEERT